MARRMRYDRQRRDLSFLSRVSSVEAILLGRLVSPFRLHFTQKTDRLLPQT